MSKRASAENRKDRGTTRSTSLPAEIKWPDYTQAAKDYLGKIAMLKNVRRDDGSLSTMYLLNTKVLNSAQPIGVDQGAPEGDKTVVSTFAAFKEKVAARRAKNAEAYFGGSPSVFDPDEWASPEEEEQASLLLQKQTSLPIDGSTFTGPNNEDPPRIPLDEFLRRLRETGKNVPGLLGAKPPAPEVDLQPVSRKRKIDLNE